MLRRSLRALARVEAAGAVAVADAASASAPAAAAAAAAVPPPTFEEPTRAGCPVPLHEGGGDYIRNTTLTEPVPGYARRWKWYAGYVETDARLPFSSGKSQALCNGSWFAVPHIGRHVPGTPRLHVLTANHVVHPFRYPDLFDLSRESSNALVNFYSEHDVTCRLYTANGRGDRSSNSFAAVPDLTYAHPLRHLDSVALHPSPAVIDDFLDRAGAFRHAAPASEAGPTGPAARGAFARDAEQSLEEMEAFEAADERRFPFHFQLLSFDCGPLAVGTRVMVHGHEMNDTLALTAKMLPRVMRCRVTEVAASTFLEGARSDDVGYVTVESEEGEPFPPGVCGGPVLRDGRVVGMLVSSLADRPDVAVCVSAAALRGHLLRVEEAWRYPAPPSSNWLRNNGLLTGPTTVLPTASTDATQEEVPLRYLAPGFVPRPTTTRRVRDHIDTKFNDPLPENFQPPLLEVGADPAGAPPRRRIATRDRTNPYGLLPADSGLNVPSVALFTGYAPEHDEAEEAGLAEAADARPGWLHHYGSAAGYLRAHGADERLIAAAEGGNVDVPLLPLRQGKEGVVEGGALPRLQVTHFKNYNKPEAGSAEVAGGLVVDATERRAITDPAKLLQAAEGAEVEEAGSRAAATATAQVLATDRRAMERFFGQEEYVEQRRSRVSGERLRLEQERRLHLASGDGAAAAKAETALAELAEREQELSWHRGEQEYVSEASRLFRGPGGDEAGFLEGGSSGSVAFLDASSPAVEVVVEEEEEEVPGFAGATHADALVRQIEEALAQGGEGDLQGAADVAAEAAVAAVGAPTRGGGSDPLQSAGGSRVVDYGTAKHRIVEQDDGTTVIAPAAAVGAAVGAASDAAAAAAAVEGSAASPRQSSGRFFDALACGGGNDDDGGDPLALGGDYEYTPPGAPAAAGPAAEAEAEVEAETASPSEQLKVAEKVMEQTPALRGASRDTWDAVLQSRAGRFTSNDSVETRRNKTNAGAPNVKSAFDRS
eukprot:Rhum_TRINITY_DN15024_c26_g1::Rhum_TRINITY_DN15024_c26_g1_i1::g.133942::m.133942